MEQQLQLEYSQEVKAYYLVTKIELLFQRRGRTPNLQKSEAKIALESDQNSKKNHAIVNKEGKTLISHTRLSDGIVLNSLEKIYLGATRYFQNYLVDNSNVECAYLSQLLQSFVSDEENVYLLQTSVYG